MRMSYVHGGRGLSGAQGVPSASMHAEWDT